MELLPGDASSETLEQCEMAVFYDDDFARDRAMELCGRLSDRFHEDPRLISRGGESGT